MTFTHVNYIMEHLSTESLTPEEKNVVTRQTVTKEIETT